MNNFFYIFFYLFFFFGYSLSAQITLLIENPTNKISGYYLNTTTESGLSVSQDIGLVNKYSIFNYNASKYYKFVVIPYIFNSAGGKVFGEPSNVVIYRPKPPKNSNLPNKPKLTLIN